MGNGHAEPKPSPLSLSSSSFFVVTAAVAVIVLLSSVRLTTCVSVFVATVEGQHHHHQHQHHHDQHHQPPSPRRPDIVELRHNIIAGLKLEKLPDMAKVDISNDEYHCKYLEYFRRLYMDGDDDDDDGGGGDTMAAGYDNDVSAIQVQGRVKQPALAGAEEQKVDDAVNMIFPVHWKLRHSEDAAVIRAVVRMFGKRGDDYDNAPHAPPVEIETSSRLRTASPLSSSSSSMDNATTTTVAMRTLRGGGGGGGGGGQGRWLDVDVTEVLRGKRDGKSNGTLELTARVTNGSMGFAHRRPVLHVFLNGVDAEELAAAADDDVSVAVCADSSSPRRTRKKRRKRDVGGGGGGDEGKRPPLLQTTFPTDGGGGGGGRRRRTDCKPTPPAVDAGNRSGGGGGNATAEHNNNNNNNKCCREEMRVVFADIPGFDFIIEPKWFDAGLCRGRCPAKYNPATRHAFIQSLLWKQHNNNTKRQQQQQPQQQNEQSLKSGRHKMRHGGKRDGGGGEMTSPLPPPKPCCAPSKLDRLQIIHVDELNPSALKVTTWKEMAVVECACS